MADSSNLAVSNRHIDSLIAYVLDTKPYHTKLSEVVEEYLFNDSFTVNVDDGEMQTLAVLGLDYLKNSNHPSRKVWEKAPIRPESTLSADKSFVSDGSRRTFGVAPILVNKLFNASSQEQFVVKLGDVCDIPGLTFGAISPRRFDGPGIPLVTVNGVAQTESVDYHVSLGAYSFDTVGQEWFTNATNAIPSYSPEDGKLFYKSVNRYHGFITDISWDENAEVYEEWTIVWQEATQDLAVYGSSSGLIGTAVYGVPFVDSRISFTFTHSPGEVAELSAAINDGDTFVLTPKAKITVHPTAIDQTWTLIKVNPIALEAAPSFSEDIPNPPSLSIFTRGLERNPGGTFEIQFTSDTEFSIIQNSGTPITDYPKTGLKIDRAFKDEYLHFKINPNGHVFANGEFFSFTVSERKANYLVYGSVSGWQEPAKIGEWYFNGQIGFKVPPLDYFVCTNGNFLQPFHQVFESILPPHSVASPSVYRVHFRPPVMDEPDVRATVENNIYGYQRGLIPGEVWEDELCSFKMEGNFVAGDKVSVYLAPKDIFTHTAGYDEAPYDTTPYDMVTAEIEFPFDLLQEYFPLYHSYGTVIFPNVEVDDEIVVDKIEREFLRFRLGNRDDGIYGLGFNLGLSLGGAPIGHETNIVSVIHGLGQNLGLSLGGTIVTYSTSLISALGDNDSWVPLEFRHKNQDDEDVFFPDYVSKFEGYAASSPNTKIFEIRQPKDSLAILQFDEEFFIEYLPSTTPFNLRFHQQSSYAQMIRIKISEQLFIDSQPSSIFENESEDVSSTAINEGLTIAEYTSDEIAENLTTYFDPNLGNSVRVEIIAKRYVITMPVDMAYTRVIITPDDGPVLYRLATYHPYTPIPGAVSEWAFFFCVPLDIGPFTATFDNVSGGAEGSDALTSGCDLPPTSADEVILMEDIGNVLQESEYTIYVESFTAP